MFYKTPAAFFGVGLMPFLISLFHNREEITAGMVVAKQKKSATALGVPAVWPGRK
jgi:hypothetical protein